MLNRGLVAFPYLIGLILWDLAVEVLGGWVLGGGEVGGGCVVVATTLLCPVDDAPVPRSK